MSNEVQASIGGQQYVVKRARLKCWLELEDIKRDMKSAVERKDMVSLTECFYRYLSTAFTFSREDFDKAYWREVALTYASIELMNVPRKRFPIQKSRQKDTNNAWEYDGRSWYLWLHTFSKVYGWSLEEISNLDIETGIGLMEEILVNEQLEKEFQWSMTELAYPYNQNTKKSEFHPMKRPDWMEGLREVKIKKVFIKQSMLPVGNVINNTGMDAYGSPVH
jgi:hypothetical protein